MDEIEIGFAGQFLAAQWQLEPAGLQVERLARAHVDVDVFPGGLFTQFVRDVEVLAQFARDLERDPLERGALDADPTILPVDLAALKP